MNRREFMAAGAGTLAALPAFARQDDGGLVVHEWGVITIPYGAVAGGNVRTAGAAMKGGKCSSASQALAKGASCALAPADGPPALADALVKAGLYQKEADAVVEIWK